MSSSTDDANVRDSLHANAVRDALSSLGFTNSQWRILQEFVLEQDSANWNLADVTDSQLKLVRTIQKRIPRFSTVLDAIEVRMSTVVRHGKKADTETLRNLMSGVNAVMTRSVNTQRLMLVLRAWSLFNRGQYVQRWPHTAEVFEQLEIPVSTSSTESETIAVSLERRKEDASGVLPSRLGSLLGNLKLEEREWIILDLRLNHNKTLKEVGDDYLDGITRERVRQLEKRALKKIRKRILRISPALLVLELHRKRLWDPWRAESTIQYAASIVTEAFRNAGWREIELNEAKQLVTVIRAIVTAEAIELVTSAPTAIYLAAALEPRLDTHPRVAEEIARRAEADRKWSYNELAEAVLRESGEPLHWREIAEQAEALDKRESFNPTSMYNALISSKDFVRSDSGTYGLASWNLETPDTYVDIIADVMHDEDQALTFGAIYQRVDMVRPIKKTSLLMSLSLHPRFYESVEGTYGLRAWLAPRHKQTLRTPRSKVEKPDSFERVVRSVERGYDVDAIVARDRQEGD